MINEVNFGGVDNSDRLYYSDFNSNSSIDDTSIFLDADDNSYESSNNNITLDISKLTDKFCMVFIS